MVETLSTARDINQDVADVLLRLQLKQPEFERYYAAYNGDLPLPWIANRLKQIFQGLETHDVRENFASVVIDACSDKITLQGFTVTDKGLQDELDTLIADTELLLEADDAHKHALIPGQSFIIAWRDDDEGEIDVYYHKGYQCEIVYHPGKPNKPLYAAKWWLEDVDENGAGDFYIKLYYPDALYCFKNSDKVTGISDIKAKNLEPDEDGTAANPYGIVPVFAFQPDRREVVSDLRDVVPAQNVINMLSVNEVVSAEFSAFPQKYIISNADSIGSARSAPGLILNIPAGDGEGQPTSVGEFSAAQLSNYGGAITRRIEGIAAMTRTPIHYFFKGGSVPSGEALIALEAPLNKKAQDRIDRFSVTWRKLVSFLFKLSGKDVPPDAITPQFEKPATVQPRTQAEITKMNTDSGMPLSSSLRMQGVQEDEIERIEKDKAEQDKAAIETAMRTFNAGGNSDDEGNNGARQERNATQPTT